MLRTAMDSVLEQKGVDLDYIVVDGGSDDGTVELLKEYEAKFAGRMRWISEKDQGMYDAINKGIKMATGDAIGILNADDVLESPNTLAHVVECFNCVERAERLDAVYADIRFVKDDLEYDVCREYAHNHGKSYVLVEHLHELR
jgi:glycosyltransferase involved in cell wall biosynthesis